MKFCRRATRMSAVPVGAASLAALTVIFSSGLLFATSAEAATTVPLGTASSFALFAGDAITDVPTSPIVGDVGVSPASGTLIGVTCAEVTGTIYSVDASGPLPCRVTNAGLLTTAKSDIRTAYTNAAGRLPGTTYADADNQLGGKTLVGGVYRFGHATTANLDGTLTLTGDASSVWIFQATSDLVTAADSEVVLSGGAQACNVFWQVGSAATFGGTSTFRGTTLAHDDITVSGGVTVDGRLLAGAQASGAGRITLINDTITRSSACAPTPTTSTSSSRQITATPRGPVDTGDRSAPQTTGGGAHLGAATLLLAGVAVTTLTIARRRTRKA